MLAGFANSREIALDALPQREGAPAEIGQVFVARGVVSEEALARARLVQAESGEALDSVLTRLGLVSEERLAETLASTTGLVPLSLQGFPSEPLGGVPIENAFLSDLRAIPVAFDAGQVVVAAANPLDPFLEGAFAYIFKQPARLVVARASDIDAAINRIYPDKETEGEADAGEVDADDLERLRDLVSDAPVIRAVNRLITEAVDQRASDIHLEPNDDSLSVRYRVDGVLRTCPPLPANMRQPTVSRIKVMANLNIAERRLPQDGRMRTAVRGHEIDFRVATAPSIHGESVVMRILDRSRIDLDFPKLGFDAGLTERLRVAMHKPHGIVLVTGPTGSGKTTTLYAGLAELNQSERKLLTIEDPIEYRLPGVIQSQVNPGIGFNFSGALRSFLRQDPDVIMVGEIRDSETAQIAVQAALTGHMILSTLHTNTAAGAVTRLLDMGVEPFLLSSVLTAVLSQRLVRRLCQECRDHMPVDPATLAAFGGDHLRLHPQRLYRAVGCSACGQTGYVGRVAIVEYVEIDLAIARLILDRADTRAIADAAAAGGMRTLAEDGLLKAAAGLTTIEEVLRVSGGDAV